MSVEVSRWSRYAGFALALATAQGCSLQAPQYTALKRDLDANTRERVRVYDSCRVQAHVPQDLDACMKTEGYRFLAASNQDYRAGECWDDRYNNGYPKAYCYEKEDETP